MHRLRLVVEHRKYDVNGEQESQEDHAHNKEEDMEALEAYEGAVHVVRAIRIAPHYRDEALKEREVKNPKH